MEVDITRLLEAAISIILFLVTTFLIPLLKQLTKDAKNKEFMEVVMTIVKSAEQQFRESGMGKEKKEYVLNRLKEKGYIINEDEIDDVIESAVLDINRAVAASKIEVIEEKK